MVRRNENLGAGGLSRVTPLGCLLEEAGKVQPKSQHSAASALLDVLFSVIERTAGTIPPQLEGLVVSAVVAQDQAATARLAIIDSNL